MYITEAVKQADKLYPNEFTLEEKLGWADELNAKISQEYNKQYCKTKLYCDEKGTFLLPEDVEYERVHAMRIGGREITKENFTTYGVRFLYGKYKKFAIPERLRGRNKVITVIYLKPPEHIRVVNIDDADISCDISKPNGFYIDKMIFYEGDIINIKVYNNEKTETSIDKNAHVLGTVPVGDGSAKFFVECMDDNGKDITDIVLNVSAGYPVSLTRIITEKTICDMPYDDMFVQWLCAKICFWQKAFDLYNQHMTSFNQTLSDYWHWVKERGVPDDNTQWRGWI